MDLRKRRFAVAVTLTVLDLVVVLSYGRELWRAFSPIIWCRILLLLVFAVWLTSLARVWSRARRPAMLAPRPRRVRLSAIESSPERERADV